MLFLVQIGISRLLLLIMNNELWCKIKENVSNFTQLIIICLLKDQAQYKIMQPDLKHWAMFSSPPPKIPLVSRFTILNDFANIYIDYELR